TRSGMIGSRRECATETQRHREKQRERIAIDGDRWTQIRAKNCSALHKCPSVFIGGDHFFLLCASVSLCHLFQCAIATGSTRRSFNTISLTVPGLSTGAIA